MRTINFYPLSIILVVATLVGYADLSKSEESSFGEQSIGHRGQVFPCGRGTAGNRFVLFDNGTTVCDNTSGVVWERTPANALRTFQEAVAYCSAKGPGWKVPGIKDFFTVVDYANANPPLPNGHPFEIPVNGEFWSMTPKVGSQDEGWTFVLDFGRTFTGNVNSTADYVWCVRV
jgi:hypothetical protein